MLASTELRAKKLKGEFWTTSTFAPDAEAHLRERQSQLTKYEISWLDGPAIREMLSRTRESRLREILDEHFFHHPLSE